MEKSLINRIIIGVALSAAIILICFNYWLVGMVITVFIFMSLYEFFRMLENRTIYPFKFFGLLVGVLIPLTILFGLRITSELQLWFVILGLLFLFILQFRRRSNHQATVGISTTVFGVLYIGWCLSFLVRIRQLPNGALLLVSLLIITKAADSAAFLVGTFRGRHPLIERISPRKTWEGAIAGFMTSVILALLCNDFMGLNLSRAFALGILLGFLGQLGDLCESLIKRDCNVKDSGTIFGGLGGVLDIMDSIIFASPVFYLFLKLKIPFIS